VKQNLPPAKVVILPIGLIILAAFLSTSACFTAPRSEVPAIGLTLNEPSAEHASAININTASSSELEKLPGIGHGIAERIISHREQYGPFRRPEHLMMVRGISDRKFRELRAMIVAE
jgi:competence protein ComEA